MVDPIGWKGYGSLNDNDVVGSRIAWYMNSVTAICSKVLQRTGEIEIGL